jgi:hypothetical protein
MNTIVRSPVFYVPTGMRGLGLVCDDAGCYDGASPNTSIDLPVLVPGTTWPTSQSGGAYPASTGQGFNWGSLLNTLIGQAGSTARAAITPLSVLPPGSSYYQTAEGTAVTTGGRAPLSSQLGLTSLSGLLPILLIGGAVVLMVMAAKK